MQFNIESRASLWLCNFRRHYETEKKTKTLELPRSTMKCYRFYFHFFRHFTRKSKILSIQYNIISFTAHNVETNFHYQDEGYENLIKTRVNHAMKIFFFLIHSTEHRRRKSIKKLILCNFTRSSSLHYRLSRASTEKRFTFFHIFYTFFDEFL